MTFNLFTNLPSDLPDELSTTLLEASNLRIERIVSHGHASPEGFWYDQDQYEWVVVLQGAARLQLEDRTIDLGPGDHINLPAHTKHRVEWTTTDQPTIWLAIFYKPQDPPTFDIPAANG
jgi:cupin 2 domain-containing protein